MHKKSEHKAKSHLTHAEEVKGGEHSHMHKKMHEEKKHKKHKGK